MKCKRCSKDAVEGKKMCVECAEYMKSYMAERRQKKGVTVVASEKVAIAKIGQKIMPAYFPKNKNISPEGLRFFYHYLTGRTFRKKTSEIKVEIKQILEELILNLN